MKTFNASRFTAERPWGSEMLAQFGDVGVKVHWTDRPYRWHVNTGQEVFLVLDGIVNMHVREGGRERVIRLCAGDALSIEEGEEHVAHPEGEARILVIEDIASD